MHTFKNKIQLITRGLTVLVALVLQIVFYLVIGLYLQRFATGIFVFVEILSLVTVITLVNEQELYRQVWVIIVLVFPALGLFLYWAWGRRNANSKVNQSIRRSEKRLDAYEKEDGDLLARLKEEHPNKVQVSRFLSSDGFPVYTNTSVTYFPMGEQMLEALIADMKKATKCIFMEYFIISEGQIWTRIKDVLIEKAAEGVDIRLLIDDFGCMPINDKKFRNELRRAGIRVSVFAPVTQNVSRLSFNYRNHQKITIIDGNVGYTGGINLADEYANLYEKHGRWKDTGVRLEGEGVWGLTSIFLTMWEITISYETDIDYSAYLPEVSMPADGYVQPFADGPANNPDNPALEVYTHLINKARDYVYITTPYLVLDKRMAEDLCRSARSGVDVRILVPHIYDKWYVHMVSVANYGMLLENGVHVYEYIPGFIHSKTIVCDDECAVCGTINTDYRSFFLHYENGVLMTDGSAVTAIRKDIEDTLWQCDEITLEECKKRPLWERLMQWMLKSIAPLF